jgi:hypothetical protein
MDSVPNGGWLDGALDTIAALEVLRTLASQRLNELLRRDLLCRARARCDRLQVVTKLLLQFDLLP